MSEAGEAGRVEWLGALDSLRTFSVMPPPNFPFTKLRKYAG